LSELPVDAAAVRVVSESGVVEAVSDKEGRINQALMPGEYTVVVSRQLYNEKSFVLKIEEDVPHENKVGLEPAVKMHLVSPDSIIFKFGEYALLHAEADEELDAIVESLKNHPDFNLEISAHTDSRGSHEYNQWLSERRAETAANYIIDHGIDPARIHQYGFGESKLLNNCRDGIRCSDKLHAVNRRLEFDFIRIEKE
jgi:outer membrane protein OmpA-like peptidoglycan-associated protein